MSDDRIVVINNAPVVIERMHPTWMTVWQTLPGGDVIVRKIETHDGGLRQTSRSYRLGTDGSFTVL